MRSYKRDRKGRFARTGTARSGKSKSQKKQLTIHQRHRRSIAVSLGGMAAGVAAGGAIGHKVGGVQGALAGASAGALVGDKVGHGVGKLKKYNISGSYNFQDKKTKRKIDRRDLAYRGTLRAGSAAGALLAFSQTDEGRKIVSELRRRR